MAVFRASHIKENTIAMVPTRGYVNNTNFSNDAIRWLDFVSKTQHISIKHALNDLGERRIGGMSVDGYCQENNTVYQYHVCIFFSIVHCICFFKKFFSFSAVFYFNFLSL